jgi:hypothetical protein
MAWANIVEEINVWTWTSSKSAPGSVSPENSLGLRLLRRRRERRDQYISENPAARQRRVCRRLGKQTVPHLNLCCSPAGCDRRRTVAAEAVVEPYGEQIHVLFDPIDAGQLPMKR